MNIFTIIAINFLFISQLFAFEVTHQARPNTTFESSVLNSSCSTINGVAFSSRCNPALFPTYKTNGVIFSVVGKSDGDSIDNGRDLIFDPITEPLIRKLFEEKNFNSFTFNSDLIFKTSLFELSYSPYYLMADLYLFNPAFPEISINLVNRESLRLSSGLEIGTIELVNTKYTFNIGGSFYYYEHIYENTVFSLFDLTFEQPEDLINFASQYGVAGDIGFYLANNSIFIPKLSIQIKNIGSQVKENMDHTSSAFRQSALFLFEPYSSVGLGKDFNTMYGKFDINLEIPFYGYFEDIGTDHIMLGAYYNLKLVSFMIAAGKLYQNIGMLFNSKIFNVGISYAREKDIGDRQSTAEHSVYTGVDINL